MKIPETENALVLRTDFSDDPAWESLYAAICRPVGIFGFRANVEVLSDPAFRDLNADEVLALIPSTTKRTFFFIVDRLAIVHPDHPILVMDVFWERGRVFRVIPSEMWSVENNLSLGNMDFEEFVHSTDPDGIFRGFPEG
jgi:hypothetical protein